MNKIYPFIRKDDRFLRTVSNRFNALMLLGITVDIFYWFLYIPSQHVSYMGLFIYQQNYHLIFNLKLMDSFNEKVMNLKCIWARINVCNKERGLYVVVMRIEFRITGTYVT
uniref:Uncharacterized protein n=1 Tax=Glossina brevipalpis TaxID=37001 RepID=A0A1A9W7P8_9MUSC